MLLTEAPSPVAPSVPIRVPDLLLRIFRHLSPKDLVSAALVHKDWTAEALNTRWRYHPVKVSRLLALLAPLSSKVDRDSCLRIYALDMSSQPVTRDAWLRLLAHTDRVRHVHADIIISSRCFTLLQILAIKFGGPICPHLEGLEIEVGGEQYARDGGRLVLDCLKWTQAGRGVGTIRKLVIHTAGLLELDPRWWLLTIVGTVPDPQELELLPVVKRGYGRCGFDFHDACNLAGLKKVAKYYGSCLVHLTLSMSMSMYGFPDSKEGCLQAMQSMTFDHLSVPAPVLSHFPNYLARLCPNLRHLKIWHLRSDGVDMETAAILAVEVAVFAELKYLHDHCSRTD